MDLTHGGDGLLYNAFKNWRKPSVTECCENCRFFRRLPSQECRRHAPKCFPVPMGSRGPGMLDVKNFGFFPPVRPETWCGEYEGIGVTDRETDVH